MVREVDADELLALLLARTASMIRTVEFVFPREYFLLNVELHINDSFQGLVYQLLIDTAGRKVAHDEILITMECSELNLGATKTP